MFANKGLPVNSLTLYSDETIIMVYHPWRTAITVLKRSSRAGRYWIQINTHRTEQNKNSFPIGNFPFHHSPLATPHSPFAIRHSSQFISHFPFPIFIPHFPFLISNSTFPQFSIFSSSISFRHSPFAIHYSPFLTFHFPLSTFHFLFPLFSIFNSPFLIHHFLLPLPPFPWELALLAFCDCMMASFDKN